jgi:hypothetical protein
LYVFDVVIRGVGFCGWRKGRAVGRM